MCMKGNQNTIQKPLSKHLCRVLRKSTRSKLVGLLNKPSHFGAQMVETYLKLNVAKTYDKYSSLPGSHVRLFTMLSDYVFEVY